MSLAGAALRGRSWKPEVWIPTHGRDDRGCYGQQMRRARVDVLCFLAAVGLLVAGVVGWWRSAPPPWVTPYASGGPMLAVWAAGAIILFAWWRRSATPDAPDASLMGPLALAASGPLSLLSLTGLTEPALLAAGLLAGVVALPLGWSLADRLVDDDRRRAARWLAMAAAMGAVLLGWRVSSDGMGPDLAGLSRWLLASATALLPAVMLAGATMRGQDGADGPAARRILGSLSVLAMGIAPGVTGLCLVVPEWQLLVLPAIAVVVTLIVLTRFALQPLAGLAGAAQTQRDRVVAAADAERMRLASVLHDGPLADMTLLIQRLDDRGDADSAAIARAVASELRAIGSELRLPVLDDLGTGPALEWLVARMQGRWGTPIAYRQRTTGRPPAEVELAAYRIAQEALVNAIRHGLPPIEVSYLARVDGAELVVDDSGPGLARDAVARAERDGRLGLSSMTQRAQAVGARLVLTARPEGGTRVVLSWRAPVPGSTLVEAPIVAAAPAMGAARARP